MSTASLGGPLLSGSAAAAALLRGGTWNPYDRFQSCWSLVFSIQSHFMNALASATCLLLAFTISDQPPQKVAGLPFASKAGQVPTTKSSPISLRMPGIAHRPVHWI